MSISTFQEKIFKSGCGTGILVFCALVFVGSLTYASCQGNQGQQANGGAGTRQVVVSIAGTPVYSDSLQQQVQEEENRIQQQSGQAPSPKDELFAAGAALQRAVHSAAGVKLLETVGADTSDAAIVKAFEDSWPEQLLRTKLDLMQRGLIKSLGNDQEFNALIKKQTGMTPDQLKADQLKKIQDGLKSPDTKSAILTEYAPQLAKDALQKKMNPSDAQVKASYDNYTFKRIVIASTGKTPQQVQSQIEKAQADLKSGTSFEQAMDRYSTDLPDPKKKVSDKIISLRAPELESDAQYSAIKSLKPGEVSGVVDVPEGKAIYKLISVKNEAPPDFEKNKASFRQQYISSQVQAELTKDQTAIAKDASLLKWSSPALKAVYDYAQASNDPTLRKDETAYVAKMKEIASEAKEAMKDQTPGDDRWAGLTYYAAIDDAWTTAKDKSALRDDRVASLQALLTYAESLDARLQLVDLAEQTKNADMAYQQLLGASKANADYTGLGQKNWADVNAKLQELENSKLLTMDQAKEIQASQDKWRADKAQNDKDQAAQAAAQAAEAKAQVEQSKKEKAMEEQTKKEMEKNKSKAPTAPAPGATTGTPQRPGTATTGPAGPPPVTPPSGKK